MENFWSYKICENFVIFQIGKLKNFLNYFNLKNQIFRSFDMSHYSQFFKFSYLSSDINQFRRFNCPIFISYFSDSRKFGRLTFEHSFILKFETSAIIKSNFEILTFIHRRSGGQHLKRSNVHRSYDMSEFQNSEY